MLHSKKSTKKMTKFIFKTNSNYNIIIEAENEEKAKERFEILFNKKVE
jgi:hypothetical protein